MSKSHRDVVRAVTTTDIVVRRFSNLLGAHPVANGLQIIGCSILIQTLEI